MLLTDLPSFEATWWPVQLETVPGSGENLTVAVVVRAASGQATVRQAIPPAALQSIFGTAGKGMALIVGHTVLHIRKLLDQMVPVEALEMPFGNTRLGGEHDCLARDLNEVFDIAMRMATAFSLSMFGTQTEESADREVRAAFAEWAEKVRIQVLSAEWQDSMKQSFNVPIAVNSRKRLRLGFVHGGYVAQFGVLRPGKSVNADVRALKLKLFDFDTLNRGQLLPVSRAEILIGYQEPGDTYTRRQADALLDSWAFIESEARARNVYPIRCKSAAFAAQHLHEMVLAA